MGTVEKLNRLLFAEFANDHRFCWACQVQPLPKIDSGFSLKTLEICHIAGGARRTKRGAHDRRNLVCNCKAHHMIETNSTFSECRDARLTTGNMLWLKQRFDPDHFDLDYLREQLRHQAITPVPLEPIEFQRTIGGA